MKDSLSDIESDFKSKIFDIEMKLNEKMDENNKMKIQKENEINSKKDEISILLSDISTINDLCTLGSKKLIEKQNEFDQYRALALLVRYSNVHAHLLRYVSYHIIYVSCHIIYLCLCVCDI